MKLNPTRTTGKNGEQAVAQWLQDNGFTLLEQNFTVRQGEVDLIVTKNELIIFVEVKTRKNQYFPLSQVITPSKQRKIITAAKRYLLGKQYVDKLLRFDVALVTESDTYHIEYIPNAFNEGIY